MQEEIELILEDAEEQMKNAISHLETELIKIRAGKASPGMLTGVKVDYYGSQTPLSQVANVNTLDARTIVVQPWEKTMIEPIEKAIITSNLGFNPMNNGENIMINVPALTEERRRELVKQTKSVGENSKVSIRNTRKDSNNEIKKLTSEGVSEDAVKIGEENVQELTNSYIKKIDDILFVKEKEIMTV